MPKIIVRLPADVKVWLATQSAENASSQSSEVVRALRERMARCGPFHAKQCLAEETLKNFRTQSS
jgi:hypothetical protein